jgi:hypothetical protein
MDATNLKVRALEAVSPSAPSPFLPWFRFSYDKFLTLKVSALQGLNRFLRLGLGTHLDKSETPRPAGPGVCDHTDRFDGPIPRKHPC